jgi:hypothetical protein
MQHFLIYLFLKTIYMFQAVPPPIIRSKQLYIRPQVSSANTAASCYRGRDGTTFHLILPLSLLWLYNIFPHLINGTILKRGVGFLNIKCFIFLYNFCPKHLSFWEEMSEIRLWMCIGLGVKLQLFLSQCNETSILSTDFRKKKILQISNVTNPRPVGAELFHADRRTDGRWDRHDEANSRSSQFCKCPPKKTEATSSMKIIYSSNDTAHRILSDVEAADTRM